LSEFWEDLIQVRYTVNKALEIARAARKIGSSLEAQVVISVDDGELKKKVSSLGTELAGFFITSQAALTEALDPKLANGQLATVSENGVTAVVLPALGSKCPRCWKFSEQIGADARYAELCQPCAIALTS